MNTRFTSGAVALLAAFVLLPSAPADAQTRQRYPSAATPGGAEVYADSGLPRAPHAGGIEYGVPGRAGDDWRNRPPSRYPGRFPNPGDRFAFDRGYRDGYEEGIEAGRRYERYDPYREKDYRKGDRGYDRRYGSREYYKAAYREGFLRGYDLGYRDSRYRSPRGSWGGWRWP